MKSDKSLGVEKVGKSIAELTLKRDKERKILEAKFRNAISESLKSIDVKSTDEIVDMFIENIKKVF